MPDDLARYKTSALRSYGYRGVHVVPANSNPSVSELLSRNEALSMQNKQLTVAFARLTAGALVAIDRLTPRQHQVMVLVLQGKSSKNIAADLNISQRTVENHRAAIMRRTGAASLPALVRLSLGIA